MSLVWEENVSLKSYNTFGIEAKARQLVRVTTEQEVQEVVTDPSVKDKPLFVLGGGSNILLTQDVAATVIKMELRGVEAIEENEEEVLLKVMAGETWHELVLYCIEHGYAGMENLSLIPGLVGAAPMQNIGAYGVEIKEMFHHLNAIEIATGEKRSFSKEECAFGYRESVFKKELKGKYIITAVFFQLKKKPSFNVSYGAIQDTLKEMKVEELSIKAVSDAVIAIRQSKLPDPKDIGNSGSFFKNPELEADHFGTFYKENPTAPHYPLADGRVKVPAGWLIEQAGWKGKRVGNTGAHAKQALVLVNYGEANGKEIYDLALKIQASVKEKFGITIMPEVNVI